MNNQEPAVEKFDHIVRALYTAAVDWSQWKHALKLLGSAFDAASVVMVVRPSAPKDPGFIITDEAEPDLDALSRYQSGWYNADPLLLLPPEQVMIGSEVVSEDEWFGGAFYKEYLSKNVQFGPGHALAVNIVTSAGTVSRFRVHRDFAGPKFQLNDKRLLERLVPHIRQALHIGGLLQRSEAERQMYEEAIDRLQIGSIVLDEGGRALRVNASATRMLTSHDGIKLTNGVVEASDRTETQLLRRSLERSAENPDTFVTLSLSRPSAEHSLSVAVRNVPLLPESEGKTRPAWIIFFRDPDVRTIVTVEAAQQMFGLTKSEAFLAAALANGKTLDDAAKIAGVKRNTARAHLRSIFRKTAVRRQSELVRVLLNGVIALGSPSEILDRPISGVR